MRELNVNEIECVNGGASVIAAILWGVLVGAHEGLNNLGRGLGAGYADAKHNL